jgi:fatty acid desaturase
MDQNAFESRKAMEKYLDRVRTKRDHIESLRIERRARMQRASRWQVVRLVFYVVVALAVAAAVTGLNKIGFIII